jgi:4-hydroxy-tetrahydrodipicolinate synthase
MRKRFTGCGTALVTPFAANGAVDEARVRALARRQIEAGIHFLVPCGTTGEAPTLTSDERRRVVELVVEEAGGRVPVVAGAGGYNTAEVAEQAREMERAGADGLLSVTPYYNKPTPDGLVEHYKAIADATSLPVILYNVPSRTGCNIDPRTLARLAAIPNVVGVKESSGSLFQISEVCCAVPESFVVVSGDDVLTLPVMAVGGHGVISVAANEIPAELARLVELFERGQVAEAQTLHKRLVPLLLGNFIESNPIPVKYVCAQMGLLEERYRLPMVPPRAETREKLARIMEDFGLRSDTEVQA